MRPGPVHAVGAGGLVAFARLTGPAPELVVHRLIDASGPVTRADSLVRPDPAGDRAAWVGPVAAFKRGRRVVVLSTARGRAYDAFSLLWARLAVAPLLHRVLYPLLDRGRPRTHRALRALILVPPRALFAALFGLP
ncbi:hypothetical protein EPO15_08015 [bacterium]|nr:MAG: hypothetical protein EPO15_08015 [bacterium]